VFDAPVGTLAGGCPGGIGCACDRSAIVALAMKTAAATAVILIDMWSSSFVP
jgi:hypothetical protein